MNVNENPWQSHPVYADGTADVAFSKVERFIVIVALLHIAGFTATIMEYFEQTGNLGTVIWFSVYLLAFISLSVNYGITWIQWGFRYRLLLFLILIASLVSALWSVDPILTVQRSVHLVGSTLVGFYLGYRIAYKDMLRVLDIVIGISLVASAASALLLPEMGVQQYESGIRIQDVWRGMLGDKNALGYMAALGALFYLMRSAYEKHRSLGYWVLFLISVLVLYKSQSITSILTFLFALGLMSVFLLTKKFQIHGLNAFILIVLAGAIIAAMLLSINVAELIGATGRQANFSGRTELWERVIKLIEEVPWTGTGYGTLWYPSEGNEAANQQFLGTMTWFIHTAHNGVLQVASELGVPIAIMAILFFFQILVEPVTVYINRSSVYALFLIGFLSTYILSNLTEARFLSGRDITWVFLIAFPITLLRIRQHASDRF